MEHLFAVLNQVIMNGVLSFTGPISWHANGGGLVQLLGEKSYLNEGLCRRKTFKTNVIIKAEQILKALVQLDCICC